MTRRLPVVVFLTLGAVVALGAQQRMGKQTPPAQSSALDSMQKSMELQQISIQQQVPQERVGDGFFQLSRPATMGATVAAPMPAIAPLTPFGTVIPVAMANCDALPTDQVNTLIDDAASRESLDRELLRGVMRQESAFKPCAVSSAGAQGLMQLMPATALQFGVINPFDPIQNVDGGAKLLKQLLNRYNGDLGKALGAYNAGPSRVDAADGIPQIPETVDYVKQVLSFLPISH
jgi:soluble lytic murein transglycosylase-like protein